eukprot:c17110_g2_i2 orf=2-520(+)
MTPMASQEPSRTGTPILATTPAICSPVSSHPPSPERCTLTTATIKGIDEDKLQLLAFSEKGMQSKARRELLSLGAQLERAGITMCASKEEEDALKSRKNTHLEEVKRKVLETKAAAWGAAEEDKYMARYKRELSKIQAWEDHEMARAEAELRKLEASSSSATSWGTSCCSTS